MLRASAAATNQEVDLRAIADPMVDPLLPHGRELSAFVDATVLRDPYERDVALEALVRSAGEAAALRAAATAGNFDMMNRLLDGTGVGPPDRMLHMVDELGMSWPPG